MNDEMRDEKVVILVIFSVFPRVGKSRISADFINHLATEAKHGSGVVFVGMDLLEGHAGRRFSNEFNPGYRCTEEDLILADTPAGAPANGAKCHIAYLPYASRRFKEHQDDAQRQLLKTTTSNDPRALIRSHALAQQSELRLDLAQRLQFEMLRSGSPVQRKTWTNLFEMARKLPPSSWVVVDLPAFGPSGATFADEWQSIEEQAHEPAKDRQAALLLRRAFVHTKFDEMDAFVERVRDQAGAALIRIENWVAHPDGENCLPYNMRKVAVPIFKLNRASSIYEQDLTESLLRQVGVKPEKWEFPWQNRLMRLCLCELQ